MKKFSPLILALMVSSCSSVEFNADGRGPFYVGTRPNSERIVELVRTKDFYLWGLLPEVQDFNFQDEFKHEGLYNPSYVSIEQGHSFKNLVLSLLSLGMYVPVDYRITLLSDGDLK